MIKLYTFVALVKDAYHRIGHMPTAIFMARKGIDLFEVVPYNEGYAARSLSGFMLLQMIGLFKAPMFSFPFIAGRLWDLLAREEDL